VRAGRTSSWALRSAALVALAVGLYLVFELGRIQGGYNSIDARSEKAELLDTVVGLQGEVMTLKEEVALQQTHRDIDREAYSVVEKNLGELQQEIQEQRSALEFYRGIMAPEDGGRGLRVQGIKLRRGAEEREYVVRLVLVQLMQHDRTVKGDVDLTLEGEQDGEVKLYSLGELVPEDQDGSWPFQFRYFQSFDRALVLPDGFTPERLHVELRSQTKSVDSVEQSFAWQTVQG